MSRVLALMLADNSYRRAHHAMLTAAAALSLGREVLFFAGGFGVIAACADWQRLDGASEDDDIQRRGVAGFATLRSAVLDLGGRMLVCESGLRMANIGTADLIPGVEIAGMVRFLEEAGDGPFLTV